MSVSKRNLVIGLEWALAAIVLALVTISVVLQYAGSSQLALIYTLVFLDPFLLCALCLYIYSMVETRGTLKFVLLGLPSMAYLLFIAWLLLKSGLKCSNEASFLFNIDHPCTLIGANTVTTLQFLTGIVILMFLAVPAISDAARGLSKVQTAPVSRQTYTSIVMRRVIAVESLLGLGIIALLIAVRIMPYGDQIYGPLIEISTIIILAFAVLLAGYAYLAVTRKTNTAAYALYGSSVVALLSAVLVLFMSRPECHPGMVPAGNGFGCFDGIPEQVVMWQVLAGALVVVFMVVPAFALRKN